MYPFDSPQTTTESNHSMSTSTSPSGGDVLLKWGHRKRSRLSRAAAIENSSSSVHTNNRRIITHIVPPNLSMLLPPLPPPQLVSSTASSGRGRKYNSPRNLEDPSLGGSPSRNSQGSNPVVSRSAAAPKLSSSGMGRSSRRMPSSGSAKCQKPSGFSTTQEASERLNNSSRASVQSEQEEGVANAPATSSLAANGNKVTVEVIQWPRIYIALSRKEKEDDFLAMKGTKIPQRPKKRAKNVDRILQCCFPGMWLSELTKSRYEVREKKSVKKQKRSRGLKGMENLDSDSE